MDTTQAAKTLEVIRTLMERTCQYQLLTARAGLAAGALAVTGALLFATLPADDPRLFGAVWGLVFAGALLATSVGSLMRSRERGERAWSRPARAVVAALAAPLFAAAVLTVFFFARGLHLWLPGVWMLCYGLGARATAAYAPPVIGRLGLAMLAAGALALYLGPPWAVVSMGVTFGLGHLLLGGILLFAERRAGAVRLHESEAVA